MAIAFGTPVFFLWDVTFDGFNVPKLALLATLVPAVLVIRIGERLLGRAWGGLQPLLAPAAFLFFPLTVSWFFGDYRTWSLLGQEQRYEGLLPYALLIVAGILMADAFCGQAGQMTVALVAAATVVSLYAIVQALGFDPLDQPVVDGSITSTVGHPNFLGGFLAIMLPLSVGLWLSHDGRQRLAGTASTIVIAVALLLSLSQGAWAAAIAGLGVFAGLNSHTRVSLSRALGFAVAAIVSIFIVGAVVYTQLSPDAQTSLGTTLARGLWWRSAVSMWWDSPIVGHGPNAYALESVQYRLPLDALSQGNQIADSPHSVFFSFLANAGALGATGFLMVLVWAIRRIAALRSPSSTTTGYAAGAIAYFVQSLVSLDELLLGLMLWIMLAGLVASARNIDEVESQRRPAPPTMQPAQYRALLGALLLLPVATGWWATRLLVADRGVLSAIRLSKQGATSQATERYERALHFSDQPSYRRLFGEHLGRAALDAGAQGDAFLERLHDNFEYLSDLPDSRGILTYAAWLHLWSPFDLSQEERAAELYRRALQIDRYNIATHILFSEALIHLGKPTDALWLLDSAISLIRRHHAAEQFLPSLLGTVAVARFAHGHEVGARRATEAALREEEAQGIVTSGCHVIVAQELLGLTQQTDGTSPERALRFVCTPVMIDIFAMSRT